MNDSAKVRQEERVPLGNYSRGVGNITYKAFEWYSGVYIWYHPSSFSLSGTRNQPFPFQSYMFSAGAQRCRQELSMRNTGSYSLKVATTI